MIVKEAHLGQKLQGKICYVLTRLSIKEILSIFSDLFNLECNIFMISQKSILGN